MRWNILSIDDFERLAELLQPAPIGVQNLQPFVFDRSLIFADRTQLTVDAVLGHERGDDALRVQVQLEVHLRDRRVTDVVRCSDVVGQINRKARVSSRGTKTDFLGFQQHDFIVGKIQAQLPRDGQAGKPCAYNGPAGANLTIPGKTRGPFLADVEPATGVIIGRDFFYFHVIGTSRLCGDFGGDPSVIPITLMTIASRFPLYCCQSRL
ncbi:hypothetical protein D9M68_763010 [compost metagenome]